MNDRFIDHLDTPIGRLAIIADASGRLHAAGFTKGHPRMGPELQKGWTPKENPGGVTAKIARYFAGERDALLAITVAAQGTEFQTAVWAALRDIPCGETWSYGQLAAHIQRPKAVRAVGTANGANPIAIVVPCHRVIGADGTLTGYAGGLDRKRWLLAHEGAQGAFRL